MATGLDASLAVVQFTGFAFQTFQACIEAYHWMLDAHRIGSDGDRLRVRIWIQYDRLQQFSERSGLLTTPKHQLNWALITAILDQQLLLLTSAEKLKERYNLVVFVDEGSDARGQRPKATGPRSLEKILADLKPTLFKAKSEGAVSRQDLEHVKQNGEQIRSANSIVKRIRWASIGKEQVEQIITDLTAFNNALEQSLELSDREWMVSALSTLLREMLSRTTDVDLTEEVLSLLQPESPDQASIAAAASLKRVRQITGVDQRADEVKPVHTTKLKNSLPGLRKLKSHKLSTQTKPEVYKGALQFATYDGQAVLVEWRKCQDETTYNQMQVPMSFLAYLVGSTDSSFASLPLMGLLPWQSAWMWAIVYEVPTKFNELTASPKIDTKSLHDLIGISQRLCLRRRLEIAATIATAILQLHTSGWLHKSIRSHNVIFVGDQSYDAEAFLESQPYLVGYDAARPSDASYLTEVLDLPLHLELYRHPEKRAKSNVPLSTKRGDLYALGCLLTEIALWTDLGNVFTEHTRKDWKALIETAEIAKQDLILPSLTDMANTTSFKRAIRHATGPVYLEAVLLCLSDDPKLDATLTNQISVVEKLRQCSKY